MYFIKVFKMAMKNNWLEPPEEIIADGKFHNCRMRGDSENSENGFYLFAPTSCPLGVIGLWKEKFALLWTVRPFRFLSNRDKFTCYVWFIVIRDELKRKGKRIRLPFPK